jgi:hypothetical protein
MEHPLGLPWTHPSWRRERQRDILFLTPSCTIASKLLNHESTIEKRDEKAHEIQRISDITSLRLGREQHHISCRYSTLQLAPDAVCETVRILDMYGVT